MVTSGTIRGRHRAQARQPGPPQGRPRPLRAAVLLVAAAAAGAVALSPLATASSRPLAVPTASVRLPVAAEALSPYLPQVSCDPVAKVGVRWFRTLMMRTYARGTDGGITRACSDGGLSEHKEGRAWDWMLDVNDRGDRAVADRVLLWLLAPGPHGEPAWNARRFGIMYIIWNGHIWGAYRPTDGWRPYTGPSEHTDHIHFSFGWAGAMARTSWWTGSLAAVDYGPCAPAPGLPAPAYAGPNLRPCTTAAEPPTIAALPYAQPGDNGARVVAVQAALAVRPRSGFYGPVTTAAVSGFQRRHLLPRTGVVDWATAYKLGLARSPVPPGSVPVATAPYAKPGDSGPRVLAVQRALRVRPLSGHYGPVTQAAVQGFQRRHGLPRTGVVDVTTAYRLGLAPKPGTTTAPAGAARPAVAVSTVPTVPVYARPGQTGAAVLAVQRALGVRPATGFYGPLTTAAVKGFQRRHGLAQTGVADHRTAYKLGLVRA